MPKRSVAPIVGARVRLRLLDEADLPTTLAWRNQDEIRQWFFTPDPIAPEQHRAWFERYRDRDDDFVFVIEDLETSSAPVGQASVYDIDWTAGRGEFGRLLIGEPRARRRGLAREATELIVDEALTEWGLSEIQLECLSSNTRALAVYDACGFETTGRTGAVTTMRRTRRP